MTTTKYNLKPNTLDPNETVEIGVNLVSRSCDIYDAGDGHVAEIPHKDFLIFIKTTRSNYNDDFVKAEVIKRGYSRAFLIRNYWLAVPENQHPF